jgi:hypothetical protein
MMQFNESLCCYMTLPPNIKPMMSPVKIVGLQHIERMDKTQSPDFDLFISSFL